MFSNEKLKYPVEWHYKIITDGSKKSLTEIEQVLIKLGISQRPLQSNMSTKGTYTSYTLSITFDNQKEMVRVSDMLKAVKSIKYLL